MISQGASPVYEVMAELQDVVRFSVYLAAVAGILHTTKASAVFGLIILDAGSLTSQDALKGGL